MALGEVLRRADVDHQVFHGALVHALPHLGRRNHPGPTSGPLEEISQPVTRAMTRKGGHRVENALLVLRNVVPGQRGSGRVCIRRRRTGVQEAQRSDCHCLPEDLSNRLRHVEPLSTAMSAPYIRHTFPRRPSTHPSKCKFFRARGRRQIDPLRRTGPTPRERSSFLVCWSSPADPTAPAMRKIRLHSARFSAGPPSENALETHFDKSRYVLLQEPPSLLPSLEVYTLTRANRQVKPGL